MQTPSHRIERLADQIRVEIAKMITEDLNDPRIGFATVTRVELGADLQHARVRVSVLGGEPAGQSTLKGLNSAAGYVRRELSRWLRLRRTPEVEFLIDHGPEESIRLEKLMQQLHPQDEGNS
ncbi:MAG: 30S ribosome-binding factor RbfA [Terriglobia bacterium]